MTLCVEFQKRVGSKDHVDLIFDKQTEEKNIRLALDGYFFRMPLKYKRIIRNHPVWRTDEEMVPIQAGDLLAWWMRKHLHEAGGFTSAVVPVPWELKREIPSILAYFEEDGLRKIFESDVANSRGYFMGAKFSFRQAWS
jgi:hypothetical protein